MIDNSYLLGLYGATTSTSLGSGAGAFAPVKRTQPTAPWASSVSAPAASDLVRSALAGRRFINEGAVSLDLAGASDDYRKLFSVYQGLNTLNALAERAGTRGVTSAELAQLSKRFAAGLSEVSTYLGKTDLDGVRLVQGVSQSTIKTAAAVPKDQTSFLTRPLHEGALSEPVAAFQGDVRFSVTVGGVTGGPRTIDVDLADMGATPRTLDAVIAHINGKLETAGVTTRFSRQMIEAEPKTLKVGAKTVTLPAGPDQWALKINGGVAETVSFAAAETSDAVYVTQASGAKGQVDLLKFQTDGGTAPAAVAGVDDAFWVDGRAGQSTLPDGVDAVRASATAADGSVWMVADLTAGDATHAVKGQKDVALMKYDSAGNLVSTKLLGAASNASGFAIAVDDDGRVAVAGSVVGALEPGKSGEVAGVADSFVTVFDAAGEELWTQRRGARAADEATQVRFGEDGMVYVAGRAQSAMPGATAQGGWDGYVQAFKEIPAGLVSPPSAVAVATRQFGGAGEDSVQAMTVSGSDLYTAGVEAGRLVVRRFTLDAAGIPTLAATRDLGSAGGKVTGLSVEDGRVILTGQTSNAALDVGTINTAHAGGTDVFVAALSSDLQAAGTDRLTYYGGAGDDTAADVKVQDGKVWITGVSDRPAAAEEDDPYRAYLTRLDPLTGAVEWSRTWQGVDNQARPATLTVASGGASVLDRLGLPQGQIMQEQSKELTRATGLRAGDQFTVTSATGSRATTVTITATDTLETLAKKINSASSRQLNATVVTDNSANPPVRRLSITVASGKTGAELSAGPVGKDALAGLGLTPGFIGPVGDKADKKAFGLNLANTLNLGDADAIKAATAALTNALTMIRSAYRALDPSTETKTNTQTNKGASTAYQQTQLANFQAALSRLTA